MTSGTTVYDPGVAEEKGEAISGEKISLEPTGAFLAAADVEAETPITGGIVERGQELLPLGSMTLSPGDIMSLTETALSLSPGISFAHLSELATRLVMVGTGWEWWLGDLLIQGDTLFGEMVYGIPAIAKLSPKRCQNITSVCRRFAAARRFNDLEFSLHEAVQGMSNEEQEKWLKEARIEQYGRNDLRKAISHHRETGEMPSGEDTTAGRSPNNNTEPPSLPEETGGGGYTAPPSPVRAGAPEQDTIQPADKSTTWLSLPVSLVKLMTRLRDEYNSRTNAGYNVSEYLTMLCQERAREVGLDKETPKTEEAKGRKTKASPETVATPAPAPVSEGKTPSARNGRGAKKSAQGTPPVAEVAPAPLSAAETRKRRLNGDVGVITPANGKKPARARKGRATPEEADARAEGLVNSFLGDPDPGVDPSADEDPSRALEASDDRQTYIEENPDASGVSEEDKEWNTPFIKTPDTDLTINDGATVLGDGSDLL